MSEEFIEVYNFGDAAVDLTGWEFSKGVNYVFPAGQLLPAKASLAVPADKAAFAAKYGGGAAATATGWGPLSRLSNSGELIRLKNALGATVDEVEYADSGDWAVRKIVGVWDATNTPGQTPVVDSVDQCRAFEQGWGELGGGGADAWGGECGGGAGEQCAADSGCGAQSGGA